MILEAEITLWHGAKESSQRRAFLTLEGWPLAFESVFRMSEDPVESSSQPVVVESRPHETIGATNLPSNVAAGLSVLIPLFGGIGLLLFERKDRFVRFYALQSIVLGVLLGAAFLILSLVQLIFQHVPLFGGAVLWAAEFVFGVYALIWLGLYIMTFAQAFLGKVWAIPYLGPVVKRYF